MYLYKIQAKILATDNADGKDVILHGIKKLNALGYHYDILVSLDCTTPFIKIHDIKFSPFHPQGKIKRYAKKSETRKPDNLITLKERINLCKKHYQLLKEDRNENLNSQQPLGNI